METESSKYVNPFTDFGFKRLFGEEAHKDLLIDFLNELVAPNHRITNLTFKNIEKQAEIKKERKAVYDIFCTNQNGEKFIVEMQKAFQNFFKDRMIFYSTFPIREQAKRGKKWNFELQTVYCIGILDFEFEDDYYLFEEEEDIGEEIREQAKLEFHHDVQLKDQYNRVFYPKLRYKLLEMPKFTKGESELKSHFDKWVYFLKNLVNFDSIPDILKEPIFEKAFHVAETSNFNRKEWDEYMFSLKVYWDINNVIDSSFDLGVKREQIKTEIERKRAEKEKERAEKAEKQLESSIKKALQRGKLSLDEIAEDFGVSVDYVEQIDKA